MKHTSKARIDSENFILLCVLLLLSAIDGEVLLIWTFYQITDSSKVPKLAFFYHELQTQPSP